jgi:hypothetical protein
MNKEYKTASGKPATHRCIVDGEPVAIVNEQAPGRAVGFHTVEGARGRFVAHTRDLMLITAPVVEQREYRRDRDEDDY